MINNRKQDHLRICVEEDVEAGETGLKEVRLAHHPLPELDFSQIKTDTRFLGKKLKFPLIIEAMTGGTPEGGKINKDLASVAQKYGIGFGVGSQRAAIDDLKLSATFQVRDVAPDILLIANLGAVQFNYGYGLAECQKAVDMIDADALAIHLNPLQEVIQPEGNTNFSGLVDKINKIKPQLKRPLIAKCVGSGILFDTARQIKVDAIDVGGAGGTSWCAVEGYRGNEMMKSVSKTFLGWGVPTADSIEELSKLNIPLVGSGGIRSGLDAAKAIALGADVVGMALPILRAYDQGGVKAVSDYLDRFILELRIAMFLTSSGEVKDLKGKVMKPSGRAK